MGKVEQRNGLSTSCKRIPLQIPSAANLGTATFLWVFVCLWIFCLKIDSVNCNRSLPDDAMLRMIATILKYNLVRVTACVWND